MNLPRQSIGVHVHLTSKSGTVAPGVRAASARSRCIAVVDICDGLIVQSDEAETLRTIGRAFLDAAESIDALALAAV